MRRDLHDRSSGAGRTPGLWPVALLLLLTVAAALLLSACTKDGPSEDVDSDATTTTTLEETTVETTAETTVETTAETAAETAAEATVETSAETTVETQTETATETETEPETETETETEPETEDVASLLNRPTDPHVITFCNGNLLSEMVVAGDGMTYTPVIDEEAEEGWKVILRISPSEDKSINRGHVDVRYGAYMQALGLTPLDWEECRYAVLCLQLENFTAKEMYLRAINQENGNDKKTPNNSGSYTTGQGDWQYVMVPLVSTKEDGFITTLEYYLARTLRYTSEVVYLQSIRLFENVAEALEYSGAAYKTVYTTLEIPGISREYTFLHVTDLHACTFTDEELAEMSLARSSYVKQRASAFAVDGVMSADRMPSMFRLGDRLGVDSILLSGDILDFPSEGNLNLLYDCITSTKVPSFYTLGNHDWTFSDGNNYQSSEAVQTYIPRFDAISGNDHGFHYVELDDLVLVALDNSTDHFADPFYTAPATRFVRFLETTTKPVVLMLHVPFYVDTLSQPCKNVWGGRDITLGPGGLSWGDQVVQILYEKVALDPETPVVAVIAGHIHFNHEDTLPNGVPQIVTGAANDGTCRVITLKPAETGE